MFVGKMQMFCFTPNQANQPVQTRRASLSGLFVALVWWLLLGLGGCSSYGPLPCSAQEDCPSSYVCNAKRFVCEQPSSGTSCTPGTSRACSAPTVGSKDCGPAQQKCSNQGVWGACEAPVPTSRDFCNDNIDNDCNGKVDDNCVEGCKQDTDCTQGQTCTNGRCQALSCSGNASLQCSNVCVNPQTDPKHCGGCDKACASGQFCSQGSCLCPFGKDECNGACVDLQANDSHCGACGTACSQGQRCAQGQCALPCQETPETCDGKDNNCNGRIDDFVCETFRRPYLLQRFSGVSGYRAIGNSVLVSSSSGGAFDTLLPQSSAKLSLPEKAQIQQVLLFWGGSTGESPDTDVSMQWPGEKQPISIKAEHCSRVGALEDRDAFFCLKDVTSQLASATATQGEVIVGNLLVKKGDCTKEPTFCKERFGAWSLVVVYRIPEKATGKVLLSYGFADLNNANVSPSSSMFDMGPVTLRSEGVTRFTLLGMGGDSANVASKSHHDFLDVQTGRGQKWYLLHQEENKDIWDSSTAPHLDIDSYILVDLATKLFSPGTYTFTFRTRSVLPGTVSSGDPMFLGYALLGVNLSD
ncbi:MAG: hypothetical protein EP343_20805 [Deltaproteobacteria bacterium]|nr:MAG: hypothetical protein EP343_20805 [Deltaproteobacteria bacterium]